MARRFLRLAALVPLLGVLLLPGSVTAAPSPSTFNGQGMSVMVPAEAQLVNMTSTVPIRLRCDPIPNAAFFGVGGNAHLGLSQTVSGRTNFAAGDAFLFVNTFSARAIRPRLVTGGGPTPNGQAQVVCDGSTWNPLTFLVTPDFSRDPLTGAMRDGNATADLSGQLCTFGYGGGTCDSIDTGAFAIKLVKRSVTAGSGTAFTGHGMQVSFPQPGVVTGLQVQVPLQVVCNPVPVGPFGTGGNGHLTVRQSKSSRVAVGAADVFWSLGPNPFGGGGGPPSQPITCDGTTVNTYSVVVTPDFFFDAFTEPMGRGSATTEFASQICGFGYTGGVCDSIDTGPFSLRIGG